ncbi:MAG: hypothetical protein AB8B64_18270 [Granulosicoccus sp.]
MQFKLCQSAPGCRFSNMEYLVKVRKSYCVLVMGAQETSTFGVSLYL